MKYRPRFRFRLTTLLAAVTALCAWLGIATHRARVQKAAVARLEQVDADIFFGYQRKAQGHFDPATPLPGPQWASRLIGDDFFRLPRYVRLNRGQLKDADVAAVAALSGLTRLDCSWCNFCQRLPRSARGPSTSEIPADVSVPGW